MFLGAVQYQFPLTTTKNIETTTSIWLSKAPERVKLKLIGNRHN